MNSTPTESWQFSVSLRALRVSVVKPRLSLQAMPADAAAGSAQKQHEAMGFHDGWGKALDQLVAVAKRL